MAFSGTTSSVDHPVLPDLEDPAQINVQRTLRLPQTTVTAPDGESTEVNTDDRPDERNDRQADQAADESVGRYRPPSDWSESSDVPQRHLGFWQILSLIINSVIGTGIFTQPGYVLFLTKSKAVALGLWAIGGIYTAVTLLIFLEYGIALPFNGGPMVYLDECFSRPRLLALVIFSIHRILLGTSESTVRTLAINLLSLANPDLSTSQLSSGLVSLVAMMVLLVVCLLIYFMLPLCFLLNTSFGAFKVLLVSILSTACLIALRNDYDGVHDFQQLHPGFDGASTALAMVYVIYSYQGFINVNCIAGEIKDVKKTLKYAALVSIILITSLYLYLTTVMYVILDYDHLADQEGRDNAAIVLAQKAFGSATGIRVAVSLSGFGTLLFQVYTVARVKQAIAWRRIIPFYKFFGRQDPRFNSPGGGIVLHAIFTAIPILALRNSDSAVRAFAIGIYSWGHQLIMVFLAIGLLRLRRRMVQTWPNWAPSILKKQWILYGVALLFAVVNTVILVITALSHPKGEVPRWAWPIVTSGIVLLATLYWGGVRLLMIPFGANHVSVGSIIGFLPNLHEASKEEETEELSAVDLEAREKRAYWFVTYEVSGFVGNLRLRWHRMVDFIFEHFG